MLSRCFLDFSVGVRASVIGLSQISSFIFIGIAITHEAFRTRNGKDNSHFYTKRVVFLALRR